MATKKEEALAKKEEKKAQDFSQIKTAISQRRNFEKSNPGNRFDDIYDLRKETATTRSNVSPSTLYGMLGYHGATSPHPFGQMELPGMENPAGNNLPTPRRWEEFAPHEQKAVLSAAAKFGVTPHSAHKALAAQIDQANVREGGHHDSFYSTEGQSESGANLPRSQIMASAKNNDIPFGAQAAATSLTSPNTKFVTQPKTGARAGQTVYPNDEAANYSVNWAKQGKTGEQYINDPKFKVPDEDKVLNPRTGKKEKAKGETRKYPAPGYPANVGKAIDFTRNILRGGTVEQAWGNDATELGRSKFGNPKVAPFHNSIVDPHGSNQFWVSDTHSGPAAFAPHLGGVKKLEDQYMSIDGIHAFHDHIARQVMKSRGLQSLSGTQSQHWSEEKNRQKHTSDVTEMQLQKPRNLSNQFNHMELPF
jgi:hypothetical protein